MRFLEEGVASLPLLSKAQWLQKHDQATNGIMGFFPAALGEPVRFTSTLSKELRIYKNTRGILVNWELHSVDVALLQGQQAQEVILKQTPRKLYVQIPGATWQYSQALPPGVYPLKRVFRPWHLDQAGNSRIRRFGFQLVPDFSGTAHSYVGYTLKAALADCLAWDVTPTRDQMLRGYCTMSRTCTAKTLLVMQPFAPMLFRQGELPGPHLMMEFWHGRLAAADVEAAWKTAEAAHSQVKTRLEDIMLQSLPARVGYIALWRFAKEGPSLSDSLLGTHHGPRGMAHLHEI